MKTRIIHTKFWTDDYIRSLDIEGRLLFFWLITNEFIDVLGVMEVSLDVIERQTGIKANKIEKLKIKFHEDGKIDCYKSYIYLKNSYKYQTYSGILNCQPKLRTIYEMSADVHRHYQIQIEFWLSEIKSEIQPYYDNIKYKKIISLYNRVVKMFKLSINTPIDTPIYTPSIGERNKNKEIRNKNKEIKKEKEIEISEEDMQIIADKYHVPIEFVMSKYEDLVDYCQYKGKKYKDYKAALRQWVKKDAIEMARREVNQYGSRRGIDGEALAQQLRDKRERERQERKMASDVDR